MERARSSDGQESHQDPQLSLTDPWRHFETCLEAGGDCCCRCHCWMSEEHQGCGHRCWQEALLLWLPRQLQRKLLLVRLLVTPEARAGKLLQLVRCGQQDLHLSRNWLKLHLEVTRLAHVLCALGLP